MVKFSKSLKVNSSARDVVLRFIEVNISSQAPLSLIIDTKLLAIVLRLFEKQIFAVLYKNPAKPHSFCWFLVKEKTSESTFGAGKKLSFLTIHSSFTSYK